VTLREQAHEHLLMHFTRHADMHPDAHELLLVERGEGIHLVDDRGRRYLDGMSSLFCAQLGYDYGREMGAVAARQLATLPFANTWSAAHPAAVELATRLAELAPPGLGKVFFTSGGSEANEAAWKIARLYHAANGEPQRRKAIARRIAYHGVTLGALALTGVEPYRAPFAPPAIDVRHVSNTNALRRDEQSAELTALLLAELETAILEEGADEVAIVIAEPVQNAGGCLVPPDGYWQGLRTLCDRYGILLVADEVITGCGRMGDWFGGPRFGVAPDIVTLAKGLTSAHAPLGAAVVADRVADCFYEPDRLLLHGLTFGSHPLPVAIALHNIEIFERDGVLERVRANEAYFVEQLQTLLELPIVGDVRGAGYLWAIELVAGEGLRRFDDRPREELLRRFLPAELMRARLIARGDDRGDTMLHIAPPLVSTRAELDDLVGRLGDVLGAAGRHMRVEGAAATGSSQRVASDA
jgi:adenosylmethionine-8-amino-7-oxononanoate aminotransferase